MLRSDGRVGSLYTAAGQRKYLTTCGAQPVPYCGPCLSASRLAELLGAESGSGFQDLAAIDSNSDGIIDASDPGFANLRIRVDANVNGQSTSGELYTLPALGITSINLTLSQSGQEINGNGVVATASFTVNTA